MHRVIGRRRGGYFKIYFNFKDASERYRSGEKDVIFPKGTYKPPLFTAALSLDLR